MTLVPLIWTIRRCLLPPLQSLINSSPLLGTANPGRVHIACMAAPLVTLTILPQSCIVLSIALRTVACPGIPPLITPNPTKLALKGMPESPPARARIQSTLPQAQTFPTKNRTLKCPSFKRCIPWLPPPQTSRTTSPISSGSLPFNLWKQTPTWAREKLDALLPLKKLPTLTPSTLGLWVHPVPNEKKSLLL